MAGKAYAVIMAGGKGERFWPLSTSKHPKQVLSLIGDKPLIVQAVERLKGLIPPSRTIVITSADLVRVTSATLPALPPENIIGEPVGRDTAAVCALASAIIKATDPDGVFCILTADHVIKDVRRFQLTLRDCFNFATSSDTLITIGIRPAFPSTGFGYIETAERVNCPGKTVLMKAKRFVEKPDAKHAARYIAAGNYLWNSGMFVWSVNSIQKALRKYTPELLKMAERMEWVVGKKKFTAQLAKEYSQIEKKSIDYAVMEKSRNILTAKASFGWDDVGSWTALEGHFKKDKGNNVLVGTCETLDCMNNVVVSNGRLTAILGMSDAVVVQAEGATLVCARNRVQDVKKLVQHLSKQGKYNSVL